MTGKEISKPVAAGRPTLPAAWNTMNATEKTRSLLERKDLPELVQSMPADKLYLMIHDLGVDSSIELFSFVEPDQWKGLVDISCWESDRSSPKRFAAWFEAVSLAGGTTAEKFIGAIDEEYLVTIIKSIATVEEKDLDKDFVPDTLEIIPSPDGEFFLLIPRNHTLIPFVVQALKLIYAKDLLKGRRMLRASRTELTTQLTETAFRFRSGRLEDMGFLEFNVAMEILEPIPLDELRKRLGENPEDENRPRYRSLQSSISGIQLYGEQQSLFLHKVLAAIPAGPQKTSLEEHFTYLINRHCVATQVDMADAMGIQVGALQTYAMVNLGLESLVGNHLEEGVKALDTLWLKELYRAGYTRLLKPQRNSRELRSFTGKFALFGHPLEPLLNELSGLIPSAIQGFTEDGETVLRPIATLSELSTVSASVQYAKVISTVFKDQLGVQVEDLETDELPGIPEGQRAGLTYKTLLLTGLANQIAGRGFSLDLLGENDVEKIANVLFSGLGEDRKLKPEVREQLAAHLEKVVPDAPATVQSFKLFLGQCLDQLETALKNIPAGEAIDIRFLGDLLLTKED